MINCYIVDAFTDTLFKGNPAAVCVLDRWLSDELMQNIAKENNLSETAFIVKNTNYELRWFTPGGEIDLCGHATLASAYVIMNEYDQNLKYISFQTKSGHLTIQRNNDLYELDMPAYSMKQVPVTHDMERAIGFKPKEAWLGRDLVCILDNEQCVKSAKPNQEIVKTLDGLLLHITAQGQDFDTVTRSFAPKLGVVEDPVCGSGHCHVIPLWANKLNKLDFQAFQASQRNGILYCHYKKERVLISGKAVIYAKSTLYLNET